VWLGTTRPFPAFTFYFKRDKHGLWRVHAYQYEQGHSTFIVEARKQPGARRDSDKATEDETVAFCELLFLEELQGHRLLKNRSLWRNFVTLKNARLVARQRRLDRRCRPHAHFSVGSGTKLAIEDAIALSAALQRHPDIRTALSEYEAERRPAVESLQRAAQVSLQWFEDTERYMNLEPPQFAFNLLTRSLRITHDNLKTRDPEFVKAVDHWFAKSVKGIEVVEEAPPPMFVPFKLRDLVLTNRVVVSPMCQYSSTDGMPNEWHLVHIAVAPLAARGWCLWR
jgi:anthraniloyl-CoA monooxygenase